MKITGAIFAVLFILGLAGSPGAADVEQIADAVLQIEAGILDSTQIFDLSNATINSVDLELNLTGRIAMFKPLIFNGDTIYYGGLFKGEGQFRFSPRLSTEQFQLRRFFKSDSLDRNFEDMLLLFNKQVCDSIRAQGTIPGDKLNPGKFAGPGKYLDRITSDGGTGEAFEVMRMLRSVAFPMNQPFFFAATNLSNGGYVHYSFDQYRTEEVTLDKHYWAPGNNYLETICSYSMYADNNYEMINGISKDLITVEHYDLTSEIARNGKFQAYADVRFKTRLPAAQFLHLSLHNELEIDSVESVHGKKMFSYRYKQHGDWSNELFLVFDSTFPLGDTTTVRFYYHGDILEQTLGEFYVDASSDWYPSYGFRQPATYEMTFKSPADYILIATGTKLEETTEDRITTSKWSVKRPCPNVTFNIGTFKKYEFKEDDVVPVDVYYSKDLHKAIANALAAEMVRTGSHMEKQIADDVTNSLRLFEHYFGKLPSNRLSVSEILQPVSIAYPGMITLGSWTWVATDAYGEDRMHRAHEVAHQWFGAGTGYDTYHDQWLSEGFSTYAGLLYYQAVADNDKFLDKLEDIRERIFSNRKYIFGNGEEAGPIALGYRTSSSKTEGDFGLIIYEKAAFVLHMLRNMMMNLSNFNEDTFFGMMREFYQKYKGGRATTKDFQKLAEKYTGIKLDWFFKQWIYGTELPIYKFEYKASSQPDGKFIVTCHILTEGVDDSFKMYVPLEIQFDEGRKAYIRVLIDKPDLEFTIPDLAESPKKLRLNPFESVLADVKQ